MHVYRGQLVAESVFAYFYTIMYMNN